MTNLQIDITEKFKPILRKIIKAITTSKPADMFNEEELASFQKFSHTAWHKALYAVMLDMLGMDVMHLTIIYTMTKAAYYKKQELYPFVYAMTSVLARTYISSLHTKDIQAHIYDISRGSINLNNITRKPAYIKTSDLQAAVSAFAPKFEIKTKAPYCSLSKIQDTLGELRQHHMLTTKDSSDVTNTKLNKLVENIKPHMLYTTCPMTKRIKACTQAD